MVFTISKKRTLYSPKGKTNDSLTAIKNEETAVELAARFETHPTMIYNWNKTLLAGAAKISILDKTKKDHDATVVKIYPKSVG